MLRAAGATREFVVTFVREPVSRDAVSVLVLAATGSDKSKKTRKARCATPGVRAGERARANNQHQYMLGGAANSAPFPRRRRRRSARSRSSAASRGRARAEQRAMRHEPRARTSRGADPRPQAEGRRGSREQDEARGRVPGGRRGVRAARGRALASPDLFVGVVEHFDLSLLARGRLFPDLDVDYCRRNSVVARPTRARERRGRGPRDRGEEASRRASSIARFGGPRAARCVSGAPGAWTGPRRTTRRACGPSSACGTSGHTLSFRGPPLDEPTAWSPSGSAGTTGQQV